VIVFKELTREEMQSLEVEMCTLCVHCGIVVDCARAHCMPHQRSDNKRGYFMEETEVLSEYTSDSIHLRADDGTAEEQLPCFQ
jgi:hypothetical protein